MGSREVDLRQRFLDPADYAGKIDWVIHFAGLLGTSDARHSQLDLYETNVLGSLRVAEFCQQTSASMLYVSTYVYSNKAAMPTSELEPVEPRNPYTLSKWIAEMVCQSVLEKSDSKLAIARVFNVYGPNQRITSLVPAIIDRVLNEKSIQIIDGSISRDLVYVDDVISALLSLVASSPMATSSDIFNIASGKTTSVAELVSAIQTLAGTRKPVIYSAVGSDDVIKCTLADISKISGYTGWTPETSLMSGLENCINLFSTRSEIH